jgi:serine/threonine-protein kinase
MTIPGGMAMAANTMDSRLLAGQLVGDKYRVSHLLGEGGMASVWAGTNERTGKLVALKVIRRSFMATPGAEGVLQSEGLAASRVNHPNVVTVFDLIEHEGTACIVMELLDGVSLATYVAQHKPLGLVDTVGILLPAMRGVASAHAQGVIHRDLKPQNIFVCVDADGRVVTTKVLDFGISMMMDWARGQSVSAMPGIVGTPSYMAPEHIQGSTTMDPRTDVYGFGMLFYEALSGGPAFPNQPNMDDVLKRVLTEPAPPLQALRPDLPQEITGIIEIAIAKRPEERFESLGHMMAAIEEQMLLLSQPVTGRTPAPVSLMSYSLSGPLSLGIPSHVAREASEPHVIQAQGQASKDPSHPIPGEQGRKPPTGPTAATEGEKPRGKRSSATFAPTVLLARAIVSRGLRDWSNHHYLRKLRGKRKTLRIVALPCVALLSALVVWAVVRSPAPSRPGPSSAPGAAGEFHPAGAKASRPEVVPVGDPFPSEPKLWGGASAEPAATETRTDDEKKSPKHRKGKAHGSRAHQTIRRAGALKVDDF